MGTTRMHRDPAKGVVDADCRLHSAPNVLVASSSTFVTGGIANPTLTVVALALRIADRLEAALRPGTIRPGTSADVDPNGCDQSPVGTVTESPIAAPA